MNHTMVATRQQIDTVSFPVEGMTCAACVNRITRFLDHVDGVENATVNLATETATVRFDPGRVDIERLGAAVEAAGYEARTERAVGDVARGGRRGRRRRARGARRRRRPKPRVAAPAPDRRRRP